MSPSKLVLSVTTVTLLCSPSLRAGMLPISPSSLKTGQLESDSDIFVVQEQMLTLSADLAVDGTPADPMGTITGGKINSGMTVQSWLLHSDKIGVTQDRVDVSGEFDFGATILGLVFLESTLDDTDPVFGNGGVTYPTGAFLPINGRYYRGTGPGDTQVKKADVWSLPNATTLQINMQTNSVGIDQMRVITAIPEPTSWTLLGLSLACLGASRIGRTYI